jgi:hypothetical protein
VKIKRCNPIKRNIMDVFDLRKRLVDDYASYARSFIKLADLVRSHIHAVWMEVAKPDLGKTLTTKDDATARAASHESCPSSPTRKTPWSCASSRFAPLRKWQVAKESPLTFVDIHVLPA